MKPNNWLYTSLGEVVEFKNGLNFKKSNTGEAIKIVGVGDFKDRSILDETTKLNTINVESHIRDGELLEGGDLLFVRSNGNKKLIGRCLFFPAVSEKLSFSGFTIRGRVNKNRIKPEYASYLCRSELIKKQFSKNGGGTNISNLSQKILGDVYFDLPPLPEQSRIAQILSTWDRAIATTEKLIENSKTQKKALMQQLLTGKKRLLGASSEWQEYRLGQLFSERKETKQLDLRLLSITQDRGVIYRDDVGRKDTSNKDKSKYKRLCPNDIGYNTMRMWQGVSALSDKEGIVSPAYTIIIPSEKTNPLFMSYLFKLPKTIHDFYRHSQGLVSDTWNLKYPNFSEIKVTIPRYNEQEKIARVLQTADQQTGNLILQAEKLQHEKKALMQQLLTGKRRVKVDGESL